MTLTLQDTPIRAQLHTDIQAAWSPQRIYDDPPSLEGTSAELPRAFVQLADPKPNPNGWTNSMTEVELLHSYTVTGQWPWPTEGTFQQQKLAYINALLAKWNPSNIYIGLWRAKVASINFNDIPFRLADRQEPVLQVSMVFNVHVNSVP